MVDPYKALLGDLIDTMTDVIESAKRRFIEIEGKEPLCDAPVDDGFLLGLLDHPLVKSGRIKITISNTSADEL